MTDPKLKFNWVENTKQYQTGKSLYLGKIKVANYEWNAMMSRDNIDLKQRYSGRITLPSLSNDGVYGENETDIKIEIERIVNNWFSEALNDRP